MNQDVASDADLQHMRIRHLQLLHKSQHLCLVPSHCFLVQLHPVDMLEHGMPHLPPSQQPSQTVNTVSIQPAVLAHVALLLAEAPGTRMCVGRLA